MCQAGSSKNVLRPNPSTCIICLDYLLAYNDEANVELAFEDSSQLLHPIVATRCGHLVHTACIVDWFNSQRDESDLKSCPYCRMKMRWCDLKRVFPVLSKYYVRRYFIKEETTTRGKKFRPYAMCTICDDNVLGYNDELGSDGEIASSHKMLRPLLAARCGHYFHTTCLNQWFKKSQGKAPGLKTCPNPTCGRQMHSHDTKRIFPVSSDDA